MRTNRILSAVAALTLLLPAHAFATVWFLHDVVIEGYGFLLPNGTIGRSPNGTVTGSFITSGNTVTDWNISIALPNVVNIDWFRSPCVIDPISNGCNAPVQKATLLSPTHIEFAVLSSPSHTREFELFLTEPLRVGVQISTASELHWPVSFPDTPDMHIVSGTIVPEPQTYAALIFGLLLVLKLGKAQARSRKQLGLVGQR